MPCFGMQWNLFIIIVPEFLKKSNPACLCTNRNQDQSLYNTHDLPRVTSLFAPRIQQQPPFFFKFQYHALFLQIHESCGERWNTSNFFRARPNCKWPGTTPPPPFQNFLDPPTALQWTTRHCISGGDGDFDIDSTIWYCFNF